MGNLVRLTLIVSAIALFASCAGSQPPLGAPSMVQNGAVATQAKSSESWMLLDRGVNKIKHIVIVMQGGRSYNNLFYGWPGTVKYGHVSSGRSVKIKPLSLASTWSLGHDLRAFFDACRGTGSLPGTDCQMDGFNMERGGACNKRKNPNCPFEYPPYAYVPHDEIRPYLEMAEQYVVANEMYTSDFDLSSFELNQFLIAAVDTGDTYDDPTGPWGCSGRRDSDRIKLLPAGPPPHKTTFPCWNATTLGDELDSANVTWAYYAVGPVSPDTSAYQAIKHIYKGPDWTEDVFSPPSKFLKDISGGELRNVTWITPTYKDSDAAGSGSSSGPSWVASLVNAIGKSRFWDSTAIFISWDGAGGWYDPNAPQNLDLDGLGFRVPLLVISPYAKKGYISHVHYETGSLLRFVEERYALASLGASDSRATSPAVDCFDFNKRPRKFVPIR